MAAILLLADASQAIQRVIELTFADEDVRVVVAGDGDTAIACIEEEPPDIVLADAGMSGRNGYEVASYIKHQPHLSHIPVLLLTGAFESVDEVRMNEAGCDGAIAKPFEPQLIIGRVNELLALSRRRISAQGLAGRVPAPEQPVRRTFPPVGGALAASESPGDFFDNLDAPFADMPPLAEAFPALLTAEQTGAAPADTATWVPAPKVTDELVERVAQRVLERLSDRVVRETTAEYVSSIAERLVREEIDRIKAAIKNL